ncbi:MAG: hypothetical protein M3680_17430 [Myxococcota bacterium]|nr:hypothetical protein [Myxococcota bacterium]
MRGFEFTGLSEVTSRCSGLSTASTLLLEDVTIQTRTLRQLEFHLCNVTMRRAYVAGGGVQISEQMTFDAEQSYFKGDGFLIRGTQVNVKVTNSVFEGGGVAISTIDQPATQSRFSFAFNTFVAPTNEAVNGPIVDCTSNANWMATFQNNILRGTDSSVVAGTKCRFDQNILFPQTTALLGNNLVMDPKFVNAAAGDFHLQAGSPAIDAALPTTGLNPTRDHEGTARPQGAAHDIGAFERTP